MTAEFSGQTVLVTGASGGLGRACALAFAGLGARVIAVARRETALGELAATASGIEGWVGDVTDDALVQRVAALPRLDVLVNNAGYNDPKPIDAVEESLLDYMLAINVRAVFRLCQVAVPIMRRAGCGRIVNMSSQMGHVGSPQRTVYCMTKHAVEGLTRALAVEVAEHGIRVNSVAPTFVETDLTRPMLEKPEFREFVLRSIPQGQLASVDDVVAAVLFLSGERAPSITGTSLRVDGGWTAQ
ncbi:MAG: SDR family oxidoreductase [Pseudomonadota bacterium]